MRTFCRTVGDSTSFVIAGLDPAYHQAARDLYYTPAEGGYAKTFPADAPHLERIYRHFASCAEEMVLQAARARPIPWARALAAFLDGVAHEPLNWWLAGSAALAVRGLEVVPGDLDIITDARGAQRLGELFLEHLVEPVLPSGGWISDWFGRAFLHARLEWVGDVHRDVDVSLPTDFGPVAAGRLEVVAWQGREIRVPPLELQLQVSERRGLAGRAEIIRRALG